MTSETSRTLQLEAFVRGGYQRLEALDVPVFAAPPGEKPALPPFKSRLAELKALPTDLPNEIGTNEDWLSGKIMADLTTIERVSLLMRYLASPIRIEPGAESPVHKAVPSARMLCPVSYYLLHRAKGLITAYRYNCEHHALEELVRVADIPDAFGGELAIASTASPDLIKPLYGDFSPFPCVLEAGHGLAQIGLLAGLLGLQTAGETRRAALQSVLKCDTELPLYIVPLNTNPPVSFADLPTSTVRVAEREVAPEEPARFQAARTHFELFNAGSGMTRTDRFNPPSTPHTTIPQTSGVLSTLRARSSGNDRSGLAARLDRLPENLFEELVTRFNHTRQSRFRLPGEAVVGLRFAALRPDVILPALYDEAGQRVAGSPEGSEFTTRISRMLPYRGMRYNFSTLVLSVLITVDPVEAIEALGEGALRETHLAAGALAQDFGNSAAAFGLFARPMRMMRESTLEPAVNLDGQLIYQVLCGAPRRSNFTMELG